MRAWLRPTSLTLFLIATASVIHASTWVELTTPRFEIVTDAGQSAARELVTALEHFDGAISHSLGSSPAFAPPAGPLRIYLFRNEREFAELRTESWSAGVTVSQGHAAAPIVALFAGPNARQVAIHEYVHALVRRGDWKLPPWFEEGLAEFYSRSRPFGKDQLSIGRAIPEYLAQLKNTALFSSILAEGTRSTDPARYYAASWAMVHMLLMEPRLRPQTERLLTGGTWDASLPQLMNDLQKYVARPNWKEATVDAPSTGPVEVAVRTIDPLDAEFMLAALLLDFNRPEAARQRYQKIIAAHPKEVTSAEAAGLSALADGSMVLARTEFQRALRLGSTRARVWSEAAALALEAKVPWTEVQPLLERAVDLDASDYRPALLLGVREADEGQPAQAVKHLATATKAAPERAEVWHAYAMALSKAGRLDDARSAARRALRVASTPEWERMASDLVAGLERPEAPNGPPASRRQAQIVTSPAWERPKPDTYVKGKFLEFVCEANGGRFRVEVEGGKIVDLKVADPTQVTILNTPSGEASIELKCGPQNQRPIEVGFRRFDSTVLEVKFPQVHDSKRF